MYKFIQKLVLLSTIICILKYNCYAVTNYSDYEVAEDTPIESSLWNTPFADIDDRLNDLETAFDTSTYSYSSWVTTSTVQTINAIKTFSAGIISNITGNITGNLTGNVTGNLTGDVTGDVLGNLTGDVTGDVLGNLTGNVTGDVAGNLTGDITTTNVTTNSTEIVIDTNVAVTGYITINGSNISTDTTTIATNVTTNTNQLTQVATDTTTIAGNVATNTSQLTQVATDTATIAGNVTTNTSQLTQVATDTTTIAGNVTINTNQLTQVASDTTTIQSGVTSHTGDSTIHYTTTTATNYLLSTSSATATYLDKSSATATYLYNSSATATYLQNSSATATYLYRSGDTIAGALTCSSNVAVSSSYGFNSSSITVNVFNSTGTINFVPSVNFSSNVYIASGYGISKSSETSSVIYSANGVTFSSSIIVNNSNEIRFADSDSSNYIGFESSAVVSANKIWVLPSADGSADQFIKTDGAGVLSFATPAGAGDMSKATYDTNNDGIVEKASATATGVYLGSCTVKAWVNFNGATMAIGDSFNVSSITDNSVGDYTIAWETDFANDKYAVAGSAHNAYVVTYSNTTSAVKEVHVFDSDGTGTAVDAVMICVIAIGDQ